MDVSVFEKGNFMTESTGLRFFVVGATLLIAVVAFASPAMSADRGCNIQAGKKVSAMCVACHSFDAGKNMTGPTLYGVVGRQSASAKGFRYSRAITNLNIKWTTAKLDEFLSAPQKFARGTAMAFGGIPDKQKRADLVCYMKSVK